MGFRRIGAKAFTMALHVLPKCIGASMPKPLLLSRCLALSAFFATATVMFQAAHAAQTNCVQFVERATQMSLRGNAWQWWDGAAARYARGHQPWPQAVIVFARSSRLRFGHLAVVSRQIDRRTILVDHANWSPVRGRRGHVEHDVRIVDVSAANDWSQVRVWYGPTSDIGQTVYAVRGFVYPWRAARLVTAWEADPLGNQAEASAIQ